MADKRAAVRAAGGVVWRVDDSTVQVALVHRPRYGDWSLPKGKLEPGESELTAAVREVGEELGSRVAVSRRLRAISYKVDGARKNVAYWTMRHLDGHFVASEEVDEVAWLTVDQARRRCTYPADRKVLEDFMALPLPDSVVVLVRHAKAGKRSEWSGPDEQRPLEADGRRQAQALSGFLKHFAPDRVLSANPVRCVQTVGPFATDLGLSVIVDRTFADADYERDPAAAEAALVAVAAPRRVSVVSSQGTTIPGLVSRVAPGVGSADTKKAACWVLSFVDGAVTAADYYPPPPR
ncbi:NUDIX domain-containing protein [uncultured Jatrophihabitans sp.]|uniref:NUDIX hydrolase n=1 Tax=uncultured Jatrophihabitans sp. TaxID=1610747 RepID=UPI0035C95B39